ncbi:type IX secretion system membrane protein PorP/SprF [candidate division KSB1 bacterium]|nr:type IX secretion system membrane protein PorP/SprF [candidate division KSB1 bacterium]
MKLKHDIIGFLIIVILAGNIGMVFSQNMVSTSPTDYYDPRSTFINPAVIMSQSRQIYAGIQVLQLGFLENNSTAFKHSHIGYSQPYFILPATGFGFTAQYLSTPFYNQGNYSFLVAHEIADIFTLGARANLFSKNYDLDFVDPSDPVFKNGNTKYAFSYGLGLFIGNPYSSLAVGLAVDHINRPVISLLGNTARQPLAFDVGIHYTFAGIRPTVYVNYQDNQTVTTFGFDLTHRHLGRVGLFYGNKALILDGKLNLLNNHMSIGYQLDFPLMDLNSYSMGTHLVSVAYRFSEPDDSDFEIAADIEYLNIAERKLTVEADREITLRDLDALAEYKLDIFDQGSLAKIRDSARVVDVSGMKSVPHNKIYDDAYLLYRATLIEMVKDQILKKGTTNFDVEILSLPGTGDRAISLFNFVVDSLGIPNDRVNIIFTNDYINQPQNSLANNPIIEAIRVQKQISTSKMKQVTVKLENDPILTADYTTFKIRRMRASRKLTTWRVVIEHEGKIIQKISGVNEPHDVTWDWRDEDGKLIPPGEYFYYFQWKDELLGPWKPEKIKSRLIIVEKRSRNERIFLTKDGKPLAKDSSRTPVKLEFLLKDKANNDVTIK